MDQGIQRNHDWAALCKTGGIAALLAAVLFRRNIGAEVSLFTGVEAIPRSAAEWYTLLQGNPFIGLAFLNVSLTMLSLSQQYTAAASEAQKSTLLATGQAVLAANDPLVAFPGTGAYVSLLLIALAGLLFSVVMLPSYRSTAIVGLLASGGLFWMIWHLLVARVLFKGSRD